MCVVCLEVSNDYEPYRQRSRMNKVTYEIVEHDGGWAYKVGDVFSETFATRELAHAAAALSYSSVSALQMTIVTYCGG